MGFRYSQDHLDFLRRYYPKFALEDLVEVFNYEFGLDKSASSIKATLSNHGITCGRSTGELNKGRSRSFTKGQVYFIETEYPKKSLKALTKAFNELYGARKSVEQIRGFISNHKIRSGRSGCFEKGLKPWNKGTKGMGLTGANSGSFKKGSAPPNRKPLWSERIDSKDGYITMKVPERDPYTGFPTRYKFKHIWVWEQANGPVPKGHVIRFLDGDKTNCVLENLACVSKAVNARLNKIGYNEYPNELKPTVMLIAKVKTKAGERRKNNQRKTT